MQGGNYGIYAVTRARSGDTLSDLASPYYK